MRKLKLHKFTTLFFSTILMFRCAGTIDNAPANHSLHDSDIKTESDSLSKINKQSVDSTDTLDFGTVFPELIDEQVIAADTLGRSRQAVDTQEAVIPQKFTDQPVSYRYPPYPVQSSVVRVALQLKGASVTLYSVGLVSIHSGTSAGTPFRGRVTLQSKGKDLIRIELPNESQEVSLPCSLLSLNKYNFIEYDGKSYRGAMLISADPSGNCLLINAIDVEEYLRGVVPLEIGQRADAEIEAAKAQAVAARTYTYRRMHERVDFVYDLTSSISDQVYGGADAENRQSDLAVKMTKDLILTYHDSLVNAYYHSTCGGKTATIKDVWDKPAQGYLVSISDTDPKGQPYCSFSPYFKWVERWPTAVFNAIVLQNLPGNSTNTSGTLKNGRVSINISNVNLCGRIKSCSISGNGWMRDVAGDKIRYVLRRNNPEHSILRSSRFDIRSFTQKEVVIEGYGYGHGVGMCQVGAIGRARAGQTFDTILSAYYTGVRISTAVPALVR